MKRHFYLLSFGIGAMILAANHANANQACGEHAAVVARLEAQYGEGRQAVGLGANNMVFEVYASEESGSWTITATRPDGLTCLMAAGQAFQLDPEAVDAAENDA